MGSDKLGLTLFDTLGYILPGYIVLCGLSLIEATFIETNLLSFKTIADNWLFAAVVAYFLGISSHIIMTLTKDIFFAWFGKKDEKTYKLKFVNWLAKNKHKFYAFSFGNKKYGLSDPLYKKIKRTILETYNFCEEESEKISYLERYLLADSYVIANGGGEERASLLVREGFFKSSTCAFGFLTALSVVSCFQKGLSVQVTAGNIVSLGLSYSIVISILFGLIFLLFWNRFNYYNRMKINNTFLLFLSMIEKEKREKGFIDTSSQSQKSS